MNWIVLWALCVHFNVTAMVCVKQNAVETNYYYIATPFMAFQLLHVYEGLGVVIYLSFET